jgi:hypothetical protein
MVTKSRSSKPVVAASAKRALDFEHRSERLASQARFASRMAWSLAIGAAVIVFSLLIGMAGYHYLESLNWLDSYLNAAMILSGMGPVDDPKSEIGKFFAGSYALYSGFIILLSAGIVFAPIFHRFLHRFHLEDGGGSDK